jgi:serine/threonine protein kinase
VRYLQAVWYLHQRGIAHRDIKPDNVLLTGPPDQLHLVLCDLGSAQQFPAHNAAGLVCDTVGTPANWAPEAVLPEKYCTSAEEESCTVMSRDGGSGRRYFYCAYALDAWALGVLLFELLYLRHPFYLPHQSEPQLYDRIVQHDPLDCESEDRRGFHSARNNAAHRGDRGVLASAQSAELVQGGREVNAALRGMMQKEPGQRFSVARVRQEITSAERYGT